MTGEIQKAGSQGSALAVVKGAGENYLCLKNDLGMSLAEVLAENLGALGANTRDLDTVTVPPQGATAWAVPSLAGEHEMQRELVGVLVGHGDRRVYYEQSFEATGGGVPPDCSSQDGLTGFGTVAKQHGPVCARCPMAQFGTAKNGSDAPACKQRKLLFLMRPEGMLPLVINAAPTSVRPVAEYMLRLAAHGRPYYSVITRLTLDQMSDGGKSGSIKYSVVRASVVGMLDPEDTKKFQSVARMLQSLFNQQSGVVTVNGAAPGAPSAGGGAHAA